MNYVHEFLISSVGLEYMFYGLSSFFLIVMIGMYISIKRDRKKKFDPAIYKLILQTSDDSSNGFGIPSHGYRFDSYQIDQLVRSKR